MELIFLSSSSKFGAPRESSACIKVWSRAGTEKENWYCSCKENHSLACKFRGSGDRKMKGGGRGEAWRTLPFRLSKLKTSRPSLRGRCPKGREGGWVKRASAERKRFARSFLLRACKFYPLSLPFGRLPRRLISSPCVTERPDSNAVLLDRVIYFCALWRGERYGLD